MRYMNFLLLLFAFATPSCNKSNASFANIPLINISNVTQARSVNDMVFKFYVSISAGGFTEPITMRYTTVEGTAKSDKDFIPASGTLTIQPGSLSAYINVTVKGDSLRQNDLQFSVQLSDVKNATPANVEATGTIQNADGTYLPTNNDGYATPDHYSGYNLAWSDEFNNSKLDMNVWNTETGGTGWGNHELENYTGRLQNVFLSNGNLIIEARKENYGDNNYTSARLTTQGKKELQFGRVDVRAKLPVQKGMWPAIWALGSNINTVSWPACGEIDIMELIGKYPDSVYGTMHWKSAEGQAVHKGGSTGIASGDYSQKFHVFSIIWERDSIQWLVDDVPYFKGTKSDVTGNYPFNSPFFFLLNVAVGGDWPGSPEATTQFPQRMFVDYIRVFQRS